MSVCTATFLIAGGKEPCEGKITKAAVEALRSGDILADTEVKGFVARRLPTASSPTGFDIASPANSDGSALGFMVA